MIYPSEAEIHELLKRMKEECSSHPECKGCALYNYKYTLCNFFEDAPADWDLTEGETKGVCE